MSGFYLTLSAAHIEALRYTVNSFTAQAPQDAACQATLRDLLSETMIIGTSERVSFPYATLPLLLDRIEHASYCLDSPENVAKLRRQGRRVREHLAESAVDRLSTLAG